MSVGRYRERGRWKPVAAFAAIMAAGAGLGLMVGAKFLPEVPVNRALEYKQSVESILKLYPDMPPERVDAIAKELVERKRIALRRKWEDWGVWILVLGGALALCLNGISLSRAEQRGQLEGFLDGWDVGHNNAGNIDGRLVEYIQGKSTLLRHEQQFHNWLLLCMRKSGRLPKRKEFMRVEPGAFRGEDV